jgi:hypothetical protein
MTSAVTRDQRGWEQRERIDVVDYELRRIPEVKVMQEAFEFRKDRPAHWLQRLCLWVLRKLGCFAHFETVRIERHYIGRKGSSFMDGIWKRKKLIWGSFDQEPTRLLLGTEDYEHLMQEVCTKGFGFQTEYYMGRVDRPEVMGLKVEVIPWMQGILLL